MVKRVGPCGGEDNIFSVVSRTVRTTYQRSAVEGVEILRSDKPLQRDRPAVDSSLFPVDFQATAIDS